MVLMLKQPERISIKAMDVVPTGVFYIPSTQAVKTTLTPCHSSKIVDDIRPAMEREERGVAMVSQSLRFSKPSRSSR